MQPVPQRPSPLAPPPRSRRGFALLITVTLLAFLVLLLVSLASLTRVETQVAGNGQNIAQARQNALLALNIAIGRLQRYTGPDQRVTATADLQPVPQGTTQDPASGQSLSTGTTASILDAIDTYWRGSRNRRWVGVWKDPNPSRTGLDPDNPSAGNPSPALLTWLVSGNESSGAAYAPGTQIANFNLAGVTSPSAATATFGTAVAPYRLLVGAGTAGITAANDIDRAVVAPQVDIKSDTVPGQPGSTTIGHYAWWVGDEGVKARANVIDAYVADSSAEAPRTRLQSAQRPAVESMTGMSGLYPANDAGLAKVIASNQLSQVNSAPAFRTGLQSLCHDLTVSSRGVLADVRHGGLKADLSWMLGQASTTDFQGDLRSLYADNTVTAADPILGPVFTPYVAAPGTGSFTGNFALGLGRTATWAQLRSYFNMGNAPSDPVPGVVSGGTAQARIQRVDTQGVGPLMVQAKAFFGLQVDAAGNVSLRVRPLVVLANPYDITLTGNFWVRFNRPLVTLYMGTFDAANPPPAAPTSADLGKFSTSYSVSYQTRMILTLQNVSIPPGEARVYCLDQNYNDTGSGATQTVKLAEGYDEAPIFTMNTGRSLGTNTHAALYVNSGQAEAWLYGQNPATNSGLDDNLIQYVYGRPLNQAGVGTTFFLVYPTAAGETKDGGGCWYLIYDAITTSPSVSQQSNFLQYNLRTLAMFYTASSSYNHPIENSQSYQRNGSPGNDAWFTADLMFDMAGDRVRWGPVDKAAPGSPPTTAPAGVGADTGFVNILYDLPRSGYPLSSIARLQHFNPSGFISNGRFGNTSAEQFATQANTFQLNYPAGNSYPNPRVPRDRAFFANTSNAGSTNVGTAYDGSWLCNEVLADRFFFSTYPSSGPFDFTNDKLVNNRLRPFRPAATVAWNDTASFRGAPRTAAADLMVDGAFNINSTSREAWKAVLSSLKGVPVGIHANTGTPRSRTLYPTGGSAGARTANTADAWDGFDTLGTSEIDSLADELVLQIRRRGPFLSMADFMNRRLAASGSDPLNLGLSGALQSAIDAILNAQSDVDSAFRVQSKNDNFAETDYRARTMTAGSPGYLLQADLLSPLGPVLAARSDTFTIRTYGDTVNPATGEVVGRAWCEAVVQRTPDYVVPKASGGNDPSETPAAGSDNETYGRRYQIVSFRWLGPDDL